MIKKQQSGFARTQNMTGKGCQMVKMVYDGRSVSDGCQIVVRWVYDGRRVSFDVGCLYYVAIFYYYLHILWPTMYIKI